MIEYNDFEEVLRVATGNNAIKCDTDLKNAGITSLQVMRLMVALKKRFGLSITLKNLITCNTARDIYNKITGDSQKIATQNLRPGDNLLDEQKGIIAEVFKAKNSDIYNISFLFALKNDTDILHLANSIKKTCEIHPYIKSVIVSDQNGNYNAKKTSGEVNVDIIDVDSLPKKSDMLVKFNLIGGVLYKFTIYRVKNGKSYLFMQVHHIITDGSSIGVFLEDLRDIYNGKEISKIDEVAFNAAALSVPTADGDDALKYWTQVLQKAQSDTAPLIQKDCAPDSKRVLTHGEKTYSGATIINDFCKLNGLSQNAFFHAAFAYTQSKFCGSKEALFKTIFNGRDSDEKERAFGLFVKNFPFYTTIDENDKILTFIDSCNKIILEGMAQTSVFTETLEKKLGIDLPLLFAFQGDNFNFDQMANFIESTKTLTDEEIDIDLVFNVFTNGDAIDIKYTYNNVKFNDDQVHSLLDTFVKVLGEFTKKNILHDIDLLTAKTRERLIEINKDDEPFDNNWSVVGNIENYAKNDGSKTALICNDKKMSYATLSKLSTKLAIYLIEQGVGREDIIAILVNRSIDMAVYMLGVLKAGCCYMPLDATYPKERLDFMIKDTHAKILIASDDLLEKITKNDTQIILTSKLKDIFNNSDYATQNYEFNNNDSDAFVILYTSGTTGVPKGITLEHKNVKAFISVYKNHTALNSFDVTGAYASIGFDAHILDFYPTLTTGATVVIVSDDMRLDIIAMDEYYTKNKVSIAFFTTQVARQYALLTENPHLKILSMGGEKLVNYEPPKKFTTVNIYGPTECTVAVTMFDVKSHFNAPPVGTRNKGTFLYVVDSEYRILPFGARGQLIILGDQVGRGYLNRSDLKGKGFIDNPLDVCKKYKKAYCTGDLSYMDQNGLISIVGRLDSQVKIRGFRIELGEVENALRNNSAVSNVAVVTFTDSDEQKYIVAYVTGDSKIDIDALKSQFLKEKPAYMLPSVIIQLDKIPVTTNGKVDKRALPKVDKVQVNVNNKVNQKVPPASDLEKTICNAYSKVLGVEQVSLLDDFFESGGTSLLALRLLALLKTSGVDLTYQDIFKAKTPLRLELAAIENKSNKDIDIRKVAASGATVPVLKIQKELESNSLDTLRDYFDKEQDITVGNKLGNVLITGATGFLGNHVIRALMDNAIKETVGVKNIICVARGKNDIDALKRVNEKFLFYNNCTLPVDVKVIACDLSKKEEVAKLEALNFDTIINCAACVKHFESGNTLEDSNVKTVMNLISLIQKKAARLIHSSTLSVAGYNVDNTLDGVIFSENNLDIGQELSNSYMHTKYLAERLITSAIKNGLPCKIMRLGNLMARDTDGKFQENAATNSFLWHLKAYRELGYFPISMLEENCEFSPIDCVARAILLLSTTDNNFTVFHVQNNHFVTYGDVINAINATNIKSDKKIKVVSDALYKNKIDEYLKESKNGAGHCNDPSLIEGLLMYEAANNNTKDVLTNSNFTQAMLYKLGFTWPVTDNRYLKLFIKENIR